MVNVKKLLKWLATGLLTVATLFSVAIIYVTFAVDINSFRSDIESMARQQGLDLTIEGDLAWTFLPQPGISIGHVGFSDQNIVSGTLDKLTLSVAWTDLLAISGDPSQLTSGSVQVSGGQMRYQAHNSLPVQLDNIDLRVRNVALDGSEFPLAASAQAFGGQQFAVETDVSVQVVNSTIDRINLSDLSIEVNEIKVTGNIEASSQMNFIQGNLQTNRFNLAQQLQLVSKLLPTMSAPKFANPSALRELSIESRFAIDQQALSDISTVMVLDNQSFDINLSIDQQRNKLITKISGDSLNVADYMSETSSEADNSALFAPLAIPFALWQGQSQVEINIGKILLDGFAVDNFYSNIFGNQRVLRITSLNADLFGGQVNAIAKLDMRLANPSLSLQPSVNNIDLALALPALADYSGLSGTIDLEANIQGAGNDTDSILKSLNGAGQLYIESPSYRDINIEQTFCDAAALFGSGGRSSQQWAAGTKLEDFTGDFQFGDGNLTITDFSTATGNLNINGRGTLGMLSQKYNFKTKARLDGATTSSTGCSVNKRLHNREIPFICKGRFNQGSTSCKPDERVLKELLKNSALEKLGSKLLKNNNSEDQADPLKSLFNDFLKRNLN